MMKDLGEDLKKVKKNTYYFRDSFNRSNLASVIGLPYSEFQTARNQSKKIAFIRKLAEITDEQIESYATDEKNPDCNNAYVMLGLESSEDEIDPQSLICFLKNKRDYIAAIVKAEIIRIVGDS
jgi:hypothetical protein